MTAIPDDIPDAGSASTPDSALGRGEAAAHDEAAAASRVLATVIAKPCNAETTRRKRSRRPLTRAVDPG
jgi:hypothetical protein